MTLHHRLGFLLFGLLISCVPTRGMCEVQPVTVDPAKADADFALQGEYSGEVTGPDNAKMKLGIQIVAMGEHKLQATILEGGLPGDGLKKRVEQRFDATANGSEATFALPQGKALLKGGQIEVQDAAGKSAGMLKKVERSSPTMGEKPPEGATILFDGSSPAGFVDGRMSEDHLLMEGATSHLKFQDCKLHLEFQTSYMPTARGQGRANSGCYLQGRYEVQILDSFGLDGKIDECGAIYGIKVPDVNMCYPPLAWQTYDIDYTAAKYDAQGKKTAPARITVKQNGVLIHNNVEIPTSTRAAPVKEGPEAGPLFLQNHKNPIRFRNIWIVERRS
ncbi:MAG: DUF1080 domain-containing protein [Planctomycetales bacterium]